MLAASDEEDRPFNLVTEWHAPIGFIAAFYLANDWKWDVDGVLRSPTATEIAAAVDELIRDLEDLPEGTYLTLGRLKVYKDPEFPDGYEVYMQIGHSSPRIPEDSP